MRGRLRLLVGDIPSWAEVPEQYWKEVLEEGVVIPIIPEPTLTNGAEIPIYTEDFFTIKVHHGGYFSDDYSSYDGHGISYFDMCSTEHFYMIDLESMLSELGLEKGNCDIWACIPQVEMSKGILEIDNDDNVQSLLDLLVYTKCLDMYTTDRGEASFLEFSFTQLGLDQREERISEIRHECEEIKNGKDKENCEEDDVDEGDTISFHGDESNIDSSESEAEIAPRRRRRVPPPNPPYRTRKRGRYSMLRGLFKNTEDNPVVLEDDEGPPASQPSQGEGNGHIKRKCSKKKRGELGEDNPVQDYDDSWMADLLKDGFEGDEEPMKESGKQKDEVVKETAKLVKVPAKSVKVTAKSVEVTTKSREELGKEPDEEPMQSTSQFVEEKVNEIRAQVKIGEEKLYKHVDEDDNTSESNYNSEEERMAISSCDEEDIQFPEFNEVTDMKDPQFALGMLFTSGTIFREAVRRHAIVHQRAIKLKKNLKEKIKWVCTEGCNWKCYGTKQKNTDTIQIKALYNKHTCNPTWVQKQVNSTLIAKLYEDDLRMNPKWPTDAFHSKVVNDLKCKVSLSMIYRAMRKARDNIVGKHEADYAKLFAYANEIKKQMPTSTVKIMTEPDVDGGQLQRFKRFYVCLGPLKEGFMDGCRPIIGLDGCHLKGPLGGILLTAVGTDPNDGMYPVAWAQVEAENNNSWDWFLGLLKDDLHMNNVGAYTFISDRQKGLVNALENQVPTAEHRFCVMHLYRNMWKEHKGIGVRRLLWCAARSTTDYYFKRHMGDLKKVAPRAYDWLSAKPREQWSRSAFGELCKSDMFVNNNCEIFNNAINKFRDMGIVNMFKHIHTSCMERIQKRKQKMESRNTTYCTSALKKLHKSMEMASKARPVWNGGDKYHVTMTDGGHEIVVDLKNSTCACRKWQLTGIPCFHAVACIFFQKQNPMDFMHECHKKEWYLKVYSHYLEPISGEEYWEEPQNTPILPPKLRVAPGRPKKKRDKKSDVIQTRESDPTMLKRYQTTLTCTYCKEKGHNTRSCKSKKIDETKKGKQEDGKGKEDAATGSTGGENCATCKGAGHNARTCKKKMQSAPMKASKQNTSKKVTFERSAPMKQLPKMTTRSSPLKHGKNLSVDTTHGGIFKPYKPPSQRVLAVESVPGQKFTSSTKLLTARSQKEKSLGKRPI